MKNGFLLLWLCLAACAPDSKKNDHAKSQAFKIGINPVSQASSAYAYDIDSETKVEMETDGKEISTKTKNTLGVKYRLQKDSLGNQIVEITYDKILVRTKNADGETELNADNAAISANPVEKLLGMLKGAKLTAVLDPKGEVKEIRGYKELGQKITSSFAPNDTYGKAMAQKEWEGTLRRQLVDNNLSQFFQFFPDSLVRIGDQWTINTQQNQHFNLKASNTYTLEDIADNVATVRVAGKLKSDKSSSSVMGYAMVADLSGEQTGNYKVDIKSGLPIQSVLESVTEGKLQTMGKQIPVKIENKMSIRRRG